MRTPKHLLTPQRPIWAFRVFGAPTTRTHRIFTRSLRTSTTLQSTAATNSSKPTASFTSPTQFTTYCPALALQDSLFDMQFTSMAGLHFKDSPSIRDSFDILEFVPHVEHELPRLVQATQLTKSSDSNKLSFSALCSTCRTQTHDDPRHSTLTWIDPHRCFALVLHVEQIYPAASHDLYLTLRTFLGFRIDREFCSTCRTSRFASCGGSKSIWCEWMRQIECVLHVEHKRRSE